VPSVEDPLFDPICDMTVEPASAAVAWVKDDLHGGTHALRLNRLDT